MRKHLLIFAIIFLSLLAFTIWQAQPPFRLQRKLLAKLPNLPYVPDTLLVTDLDDDGHPEVTALKEDEPPIWVRFPFDKPSLLRFENCQALWVDCSSVLKALPVLTADGQLRLLQYKDEEAILNPLTPFLDVPMGASIQEGEGTGMVFLQVYRGNDCWVFTLTPQGEWRFASRFASRRVGLKFAIFDPALWDITDLADLDKDGLLDALCVQLLPNEDAWVFWGGQKEEKTDLVGGRYPKIADLDGDGWKEIVMLTRDGRLKIWQFDRRKRRLQVIVTSPPLYGTQDDFCYLHLFDLDKDGLKEIVVHDIKDHCWVFQWRDGKLKMWQGKMGFQYGDLGLLKFGDQLVLYGYQSPCRFTVFVLLPKGKHALLPSNWRIQEAPFELRFAVDIDGGGSDEVIGYDVRRVRYRLYRAELTKSGKLRWRDVLLDREEPVEFALLVDGKRRGLVVWWSDGRLELLTMKGKR